MRRNGVHNKHGRGHVNPIRRCSNCGYCFPKILLSAFECTHCGERNNEVQFAGEIQSRGCNYCLKIQSGDRKVLKRQVVKSESATIKIPELEFEIPPGARGSLSTVEGILVCAADELQALQEEQKKVDPHRAEAIDSLLLKLKACASGDSAFTFVLDDPAGNSCIENRFDTSVDQSLAIKFYERTPEQQLLLGYLSNPAQPEEDGGEALAEGTNNVVAGVIREPHGSVEARAGLRAIQGAGLLMTTFQSLCCVIRIFITKIPYFHEVTVTAFTCGTCGDTSKLNAGDCIPTKGKKLRVSVENIKDLSRFVIKSDTASVMIPEVELELASGTLGGLVTTVGGLKNVHGYCFGGSFGRSLEDNRRTTWKDVRNELMKLISVEIPWTLIIDDALADSFVAPVTDNINEDHQLTFEEYERSPEQNEELGLNVDRNYSSEDLTQGLMRLDINGDDKHLLEELTQDITKLYIKVTKILIFEPL